MSSNSLLLHRFQVPCHIQEKFYLIFSRFNISDIQYPHFLYTPLVCQRHLLVYQGRMDSPQPKIIMRTPPIGYMIIHSVSSLTGTLCRCREMTDITIIIITPHQRHFIGHLQPGMVHIQHFLIRNKDLRHLGHILIYIFSQQIALILQDLGQNSFLFFYGLSTIHRTVVYSTHT